MSGKLQQKRWATRTLQGRRWLVENRLEAVEKNNVANLIELLDYQDVHRPPELTYALQIAMLKKSDDYSHCISILLAKGADPNGTTGTGTSFTCLAADAGSELCLRLLLKYGADVTKLREDGASALHRACLRNRAACANMLISVGADANIRDALGRTPIILAAQAGSLEAAEVLLKANCSLEICDPKGRSVLHLACEQNNVSLLSLLIKANCDLNAGDFDGRTPLMAAAELGHNESLECLLNNGGDADVVNSSQDTGLVLAAKNAHVSCVQLLMRHGCDVNQHGGESALVHMLGVPEVTLQLIQAGADVCGSNARGPTPLEIATDKELVDVVRILLKANCDIEFEASDTVGQRRRCPLQIALYRGSFTITKCIFLSSLISGCNLAWLSDYMYSGEFGDRCRENEKARRCRRWLEEQMEEGSQCLLAVQSLMQSCRWTIREELGSAGIFRAIGTLPLPQTLKDYLELCELDYI